MNSINENSRNTHAYKLLLARKKDGLLWNIQIETGVFSIEWA
jgi:hypothetical protein